MPNAQDIYLSGLPGGLAPPRTAGPILRNRSAGCGIVHTCCDDWHSSLGAAFVFIVGKHHLPARPTTSYPLGPQVPDGHPCPLPACQAAPAPTRPSNMTSPDLCVHVSIRQPALQLSGSSTSCPRCPSSFAGTLPPAAACARSQSSRESRQFWRQPFGAWEPQKPRSEGEYRMGPASTCHPSRVRPIGPNSPAPRPAFAFCAFPGKRRAALASRASVVVLRVPAQRPTRDSRPSAGSPELTFPVPCGRAFWLWLPSSCNSPRLFRHDTSPSQAHSTHRWTVHLGSRGTMLPKMWAAR